MASMRKQQCLESGSCNSGAESSPVWTYFLSRKKSLESQKQGGLLGKQSNCSHEEWKQKRLFQELLLEFEGIVEEMKVCPEGFDAVGRLYSCRSPRAGSAGDLQPGQSQSVGSSFVGLKELCQSAPNSAFLVVQREGRTTLITEDNGRNK